MKTPLLEKIISSPLTHAKWLNTLSFLENCGARQIAACEHPTLVKEEMLKHAAEEFRHAHHLKKQIRKLQNSVFEDYSLASLLGGFSTLHYLHRLNVLTSRYLKAFFSTKELKKAAYLLVTYAIELRAEKIYPEYDRLLKKHPSKISVKSILLEEKEHLEEMEHALKSLSLGEVHSKKVCQMEQTLYKSWIEHLENIVNH